MCRPVATMPTNWSYMSITRPCSTSRPCGDIGLVKLGWSFSGPEMMASALMPSLQQAGHLAGLQQHADRAGQRGLAGEDARGGHRDHVAGRRRRAAHHGDDRLLRGNVGDRVVQALAARHAAARAVDRDDQRLHAVVVGQFGHRLVELAVVADDPADGQPRQMRTAERTFSPRSATRTAARTASTARLRQTNRRRLSRRRSSSRSVSRLIAGGQRAPMVITSAARSGPAGCGDGSRHRGCRPARRRNRTSRTRPSPASPPRPPCP